MINAQEQQWQEARMQPNPEESGEQAQPVPETPDNIVPDEVQAVQQEPSEVPFQETVNEPESVAVAVAEPMPEYNEPVPEPQPEYHEPVSEEPVQQQQPEYSEPVHEEPVPQQQPVQQEWNEPVQSEYTEPVQEPVPQHEPEIQPSSAAFEQQPLEPNHQDNVHLQEPEIMPEPQPEIMVAKAAIVDHQAPLPANNGSYAEEPGSFESNEPSAVIAENNSTNTAESSSATEVNVVETAAESINE